MLIDYFDNLYSLIKNRSGLLEKVRYYSLLRNIVRIIANLILPVYFRCTQNDPAYSLLETTRTRGRIIISFTSFPKRIHKVWLVVESILRQQMRPDMIILWLSKEQFASIEILPASLLRLQDRGLQIRLCSGDIRSHKKYYYAMQEYPDDIIITIDDDIMYSSEIITLLYQTHLQNPSCICANYAVIPRYYKNKLLSYETWPGCYKVDVSEHYFVSQVGFGGVLYPPGSLYPDVLKIEQALHLTPLADDIWLYTMARLQYTPVVYTQKRWIFLPIVYLNNVRLTDINDGEGFNDKQIAAVRTYYLKEIRRDPFAR